MERRESALMSGCCTSDLRRLERVLLVVRAQLGETEEHRECGVVQ